jgi:hypothetical protein
VALVVVEMEPRKVMVAQTEPSTQVVVVVVQTGRVAQEPQAVMAVQELSFSNTHANTPLAMALVLPSQHQYLEFSR